MEADANKFISAKSRVREKVRWLHQTIGHVRMNTLTLSTFKELEKENENLRLEKIKLVNSQTALRQENIKLAKKDSNQKADLEKGKQVLIILVSIQYVDKET